MASVHKDSRGRSPFWVACYTDALGRRLKKSTKTTNREKAIKLALQMERAARLAGTGELTEIRARELLSELLASISDGRESIRVQSTESFLASWIAGKKALLSPGSIWSYEAAVNGFVAHLGPRAQRPLTAVQSADLQGFVTELVRERKAPKTCSIYLKVLRAAFKSAKLQQLIQHNPADAVDLPKGQSAERGTFTPEEIAMLLREASGEWRTVILIGALTGQRLRDCTDLEWSGVDFSGGTITFKVKKRGGDKLVVPMHPQLRERLEEIAGDVPQQYVTPGLAGRGTGGKSGLSGEFSGIMREAGIGAGKAEGTGKRNVALRSFHSLRHTYISALANSGVPEDVRMQLSGHSDAAVHKGYTHTELAVLKTAIGKIPRIG